MTAAPPSVVLGKPGGAALPPPISSSGGVVPTTQTPPSSFRNSVRTPLNLGGGTFNAAQQFYPASDFPDNLPKYSPNLPARRRRPLTTAVPNLNDFGVRKFCQKKVYFLQHTIRKVKFLSKNSTLTKTPTFSQVFHPNFFDNFSREIKVVNS